VITVTRRSSSSAGGCSSTRLEGESKGADQDVAIAQERGLPIYHQVEDVPGFVAV